jgi:hypothetical protein
MFNNFSSTGLDRYFVSQNMLAILLAVFVLDRWRSLATVLVLVPSLLGVGTLFEIEPRLKIRTAGSFVQDVIAAERSGPGDLVRVPIYPRPWVMLIPRENVEATVGRYR